MESRSKLLVSAAILLFVSALAHVVALFAGPGGSVPVALVSCAVLAVLGFGLLKGLRWVAWVAFFVALADGIAALGAAVAATLPDPVCLAVAACDGQAALALFIALWRTPAARAADA